MGTAQDAWAAQLAAWTIDAEILAGAPESPYGFPPGLFGTQSGAASTHRALSSALPAGGSLLDIGCGGGAASIPVAAAGSLLAVDSSAQLLQSYIKAAAGRTVSVETWCGTWPAIAADVPVADVAVAANVVYNVADIGDFLHAMTDHARRRVVVELTDTHPWTSMAALWRRFHGQERPDGPTADDFVAVVRELGYEPEVETFDRVSVWANAAPEVVLTFNRRRLCLPVEREAEVAEAMREIAPAPAMSASVVWWDV